VTSLKGLRDLSTANFQYAEWRKPANPLRPVMVERWLGRGLFRLKFDHRSEHDFFDAADADHPHDDR
jgi:hypothetical protein